MALKRIVTGDPNLQTIQDAVSAALHQQSTTITISTDSTGKVVATKARSPAPFSGGNLIVTALVSGKDNLVLHSLGRTPTVWVIARTDTNATVWETKTAALADEQGKSQSATMRYLNLHCSADCNVSIWVN